MTGFSRTGANTVAEPGASHALVLVVYTAGCPDSAKRKGELEYGNRFIHKLKHREVKDQAYRWLLRTFLESPD